MKPSRTLGELAPELRLMLACATHDVANSKLNEITALLSEPIDWKLFLQYAMHHRVYPLVYKTLGRISGTAVPENVRTTLQEKCRKNAFGALRLAGETVRVVGSLQENGIQSVVIKGPPLAQLLYGDVALRPSHDVDLLVWPENLEAAGAILEKLGYRRIHPDLPLTPRLIRFLIKKDHHFSYYQAQTGVLLELHWRLNHCGIELPLPEKEELTVCHLNGRTIPVLAPEYALLSLILHGAGHGWFRLRWLCDIGRFLGQKPDWRRLVSLAAKFKVGTLLNQTLILAEAIIAVPIPEEYRPVLEIDRQAWRLAQMAVSFLQKADYNPDDSKRRRDWQWYWRQKIYDYRVRLNWRNRFGYIWRHFAPCEADLQLISLPDALYPVYYLIRPFTWLRQRVINRFRGKFCDD